MAVFGWSLTAMAYDINDKLSIGGVLAGAYQYQSVSDYLDIVENTGRGALPIQPEFSFRPTDRDEVFMKFGFTAGNGLSDTSPFVLAPWGVDLEDDVKDINGRNRDYLLTAWYKHTFQFTDDHSLGITGGLIDSTDFLDENAFSNDEYTQFMNEALVNGPQSFLPSYDIGGALQWNINQFSVHGVYMNVGENDDGNNFNFFGIQLGYNLQTSLGEGNYRVIFVGTNDAFLNLAVTDLENRMALLCSFDQQLGDIFGAWLRFGWQDDSAVINYEGLYSGGINISGKVWGREQDNIGLGYGYLSGGNAGLDRSHVAEGYVRFGLNDYVAATLDVQYMKDAYETGAGNDVDGWIFGARVAVEF
jgi:porin